MLKEIRSIVSQAAKLSRPRRQAENTRVIGGVHYLL